MLACAVSRRPTRCWISSARVGCAVGSPDLSEDRSEDVHGPEHEDQQAEGPANHDEQLRLVRHGTARAVGKPPKNRVGWQRPLEETRATGRAVRLVQRHRRAAPGARPNRLRGRRFGGRFPRWGVHPRFQQGERGGERVEKLGRRRNGRRLRRRARRSDRLHRRRRLGLGHWLTRRRRPKVGVTQRAPLRPRPHQRGAARAAVRRGAGREVHRHVVSVGSIASGLDPRAPAGPPIGLSAIARAH